LETGRRAVVTNAYHNDARTRRVLATLSPEERRLLDECIDLAHRGRLSSGKIKKLCGDDLWAIGYLRYRTGFVSAASWAIFTVEYMDELAALLKDRGIHNVLEVGAGRGLLVKPMRARGLSWIAYDCAPLPQPPDDRVVLRGTHKQAIRWRREWADAIFASWLPYANKSDLELLKVEDKPIILVAEGRGGCCGSYKFWEGVHDNAVNDYGTVDETKGRREEWLSDQDGFHDVPRWCGLHDGTVWIHPKEANPVKTVGG
jgi:hypothetical protein